MKNLIEITRKEKNISQEALANAVGVSRQTILSVEQGKCAPSVALAIRIARHLGTSVEELFLLEEAFPWKTDPKDSPSYEANVRLTQRGPVFGQGSLSDYRYGRFSLAFNGGEAVAIYNALCLLNAPAPLHDIIKEFEANNLPVLGGFAGTDPKKLGLYLTAHHIPYDTVTSDRGLASAMEKALSENKRMVFLYSYFDAMGPLEMKGLHTVAAVCDQGTVTVYNLKNADTVPRDFTSFAELKKGKKLIIAYLFH